MLPRGIEIQNNFIEAKVRRQKLRIQNHGNSKDKKSKSIFANSEYFHTAHIIFIILKTNLEYIRTVI